MFFSSCDWDRGAALFLNRDGQFRECEASRPGLKGQDMSLNLQHADYDNDGRLDVLILRGGWEGPARMSLLRNTGGGAFEDVTVRVGLDRPIASQSAAWGDYDNDGKLDLYVVGENHSDRPDPRNLCRLYHQSKDGTFTDVAAEVGVLNEGWAKGATWGDYDDDGKLDLYVSNMWGPNRLYRNRGDGRFDDVAMELGVAEPYHGFSCWFWDYDNDGKLDLFVCGYFARLNDIIADRLGTPTSAERPRLYRNTGGGHFEDVTAAVGLDRVMLPMGTNFADIDNDGFLDMYLGTGQPAYMTLVPNLMFKNEGGRRFVDVTEASGTGHLQKGHGVSFADADGDGDLDLFVQMGGVATGDRSHNAYFRNPGPQPARHWLAVKLVGEQTNRAAFGARIRADLKRPDGSRRSIFRVIGAGSSFGGNSLVAHLGLDDSSQVEALTVSWPVSRTRQVFRDVPGDQSIEITEGKADYRRTGRPEGRSSKD
ncbi:MAG: CRTAC1 family protein [Isosphaeraceae bacterium]